MKLFSGIASLAIIITFIACQEKPDKPDFRSWKRNQTSLKTEDGREIPTKYLLDCRKIGLAENVHYYFSVMAPLDSKEQESGPDEIFYKDVLFSIDEIIFSVDAKTGSHTLIEGVDADFKIIRTTDGGSKAQIIANKNSVA